MANLWQQFVAWASAHLALSMGVGGLVAAAAAAVWKYLPAFAEQEVELELGKLMAQVQNPTVKKFLVSVEQAVQAAVPEAGDARYAVLTDLILKELPPTALVARPLILNTLTALGAGAKAGLEAEIKKEGAPPA